MQRLVMLATIYSGIIAVEKILKTVPLTPYERQRLDDALHYLYGLYNDRKNKKDIDKRN